MKKKIGVLFAVLFLLCSTSIALASTASFTSSLPANQSDREVSTVRKATGAPNFWVHIESLGSGMTTVCAWTEGVVGNNLSNPYVQIPKGEKKILDYNVQVPGIGGNITLNLDNPVLVSYVVSVSGRWDPN